MPNKVLHENGEPRFGQSRYKGWIFKTLNIIKSSKILAPTTTNVVGQIWAEEK